jgi:CHASE2 domain-containing sensor protein
MQQQTDQRRPVVIDLNPDGSFATPARPPLSARILRAAIVVAVIAGLLAIAAFAIASLFVLVPLALGAGAVGYGAWRWRLWQAQRRRG